MNSACADIGIVTPLFHLLVSKRAIFSVSNLFILEGSKMDNVGNSFFHMAVGAFLFVVAVACLMFGVRSVVTGVRMRQSDLADEVLYESSGVMHERVVMGDWVMSFVMSEPETDVRIELQDGSVYVLSAGVFESGSLDALNIPIVASFLMEYEYGAYGGLKTVCFKER